MTDADSGEMTSAATFEALYRRDFQAVVGLVYGMTGSRAAAEDIAQDAFVSAHRRWDRVRGYQNPSAWVRHVALNAARSRRRKLASELKVRLRLSGAPPLPVELPEDASQFWAAVRSLPRRQAEALALHYYEDKSVDEIAEVIGCAPATVKTHLHRGRRALAASLSLEEDS